MAYNDPIIELRTAPIWHGLIGEPDLVAGGYVGGTPTMGGVYIGTESRTYAFRVDGGGVMGTDVIIMSWDSSGRTGYITFPTDYDGSAKSIDLGMTLALPTTTDTYTDRTSFDVAVTAWSRQDWDEQSLKWGDTSPREPVFYSFPQAVSMDDRPRSIDGTIRVGTRAIHQSASIDLFHKGSADLKKLEKMARARRDLVLCPNFDENTMIYAPLQRGVSPVIGPYPSYSRSGVMGYTDPDDGLLKERGASLPPFVAADHGSGLLAEDRAATNTVQDSDDFSAASWTASGVTVAVNQAITRRGTSTADKLTPSTFTDYVSADSGVAAAANQVWIFAVDLSADKEHDADLVIRDGSGTFVSSSTVSVKTGTPQQFFLAYDLGAGSPSGNITARIQPDSDNTVGTRAVYASNANLFQMDNSDLVPGVQPPAVISTSGGTATRGQTSLNYDIGPNPEAGTLSLWFEYQAGVTRDIIEATGAGETWKLSQRQNGQIRFEYDNSTNVEFSSPQTQGDAINAVIAWDSTSIVLYVNGTARDTDATPTLQTNLGNDLKVTNAAGWIREIRMDSVKWDSDAVTREYKRWTDEAELLIRRRTMGRLYLMDPPVILPTGGVRPDLWDGQVLLQPSGVMNSSLMDPE